MNKMNNQIESLVSQILSITQCITGTLACDYENTDRNVCATSDYETDQQKQSQVKALEKQIDQLVYKLYNLTEEEIKIIEEENKV